LSNKIKISELRARVAFQVKKEVVNARGGKDVTWIDDFMSWAKITSATKNQGMHTTSGDQLSIQSTHDISIRYRTDITTDHRMVYDEDYYTINTMTRSDNGNRKYILMGATWEGALR